MGTFTLLGLIFLGVIVILWAISAVTSKTFAELLPPYLHFLFKHFGLYFAFIAALLGVVGSLYLSEVDQLAPCLLCWYQRTMFYPLPILLFVALIIKDRNVYRYILPLSIVGMGISIFHYLVQLFPEFAKSCGFYSVSCSVPYTFQYGFISIPVMAFTGFALVTFFALTAHNFNKS